MINYIKNKYYYFLCIIRNTTIERFLFQLYLYKIGGLNAGYFYRPNQWQFPIRVKLFDLWQRLFVKKIYYDVKIGKGWYYDDSNRNNPFRQKIYSISYITCSKGWDSLIFNLIKELVNVGWNKEICQVKEKWGGLRFYTNGLTDKQSYIINKYEKLSYDTCESCGSTEHIGQTDGWVSTLCINCAIDKPSWSEYTDLVKKEKYEITE
jgi:hypothetical protein